MSNPADFESVDSCIVCYSKEIAVFDDRVSMYKCSSCGSIFDNPRPTQEAIGRHYSQKGKYDHWIDSDKNFKIYWKSYLTRLLKYKSSGDLLDIGAGIGMFLSQAKDHFTVTGTEISTEGIEVAKQRYGLDFVQGTVESIDFQGKKFDVVTMCQILEHFPYPGKTLDYVKTLLKPDGILYITVPNEAPFSFRMVLAGLFSRLGVKRFRNFTSQGFRKLEIGVLDEIHLSHFNETNLCTVLEKKGYEVLATTIEFHDLFMQKKGPIQIVRHCVHVFSIAIKAIFQINTYNSFGVIARLK